MYISSFRVLMKVYYLHVMNTKRFKNFLQLYQRVKQLVEFHEAWTLDCSAHLSLWSFSTNHLNLLSYSPHPTHLLPSLKSRHLSCCVLFVNTSVAPCLMLPPIPQTVPITGVYPRGAGTAGQSCCKKAKTFLLSGFLTSHADMKPLDMRGCGTLAGRHASSFVLHQAPGIDLTQLDVLWHPCHVCLCVCHSLTHNQVHTH